MWILQERFNHAQKHVLIFSQFHRCKCLLPAHHCAPWIDISQKIWTLKIVLRMITLCLNYSNLFKYKTQFFLNFRVVCRLLGKYNLKIPNLNNFNSAEAPRLHAYPTKWPQISSKSKYVYLLYNRLPANSISSTLSLF